MKSRFAGMDRLVAMVAVVALALAAMVATAQNQPSSRANADSPPQAIMPPSPINQFRGLLTMPREDQEEFLAGKQPSQATVLRRKIVEYRNMPSQERDFRLRQLELCRWILPLMRLEPESREAPLDRIAERHRLVVQERLEEWDRLSAAQKDAVLKDRIVLSYFFRPEADFLERQEDVLNIMPPELKTKMEADLAEWRSRSNAERQRMMSRLNQLLSLNQAARDKVLVGIPQSDHAQLRSTLSAFEKLKPEQRRRAIEGFGRLANLSVTEREQFIFSASQWQEMSPQQRDLWKLLIERLQHPSPTPPSPADVLIRPPDSAPTLRPPNP